jgi:hypothetical protein
MTLTVNAKAFTANQFNNTAVGYFGPAKTVTVKDDIKLGYTVAKSTDAFSGLSRSSAKLTRTHTLTGAKTTSGDAILSIEVAVPVGSAAADIDALLNDMGSYLSSASCKTHVKNAQISY